ncbi:hypothetical protein D3C87_1805440 [compost metagenome]
MLGLPGLERQTLIVDILQVLGARVGVAKLDLVAGRGASHQFDLPAPAPHLAGVHVVAVAIGIGAVGVAQFINGG